MSLPAFAMQSPAPLYRRPGVLLGASALLVALVSAAVLLAPTEGEAPPDMNVRRAEILDAIRLVESGGDDRCPDGDGGLAIGPYQIHRVYWLDAVEFDPTLGPSAGGTYQDCRSRDYALKIIEAYMNRYVADAWKTADAEVIARTHNGGPKGVQKSGTDDYWRKVDRVLQQDFTLPLAP